MKKLFTAGLICTVLCACLSFSASGAKGAGDAEKSAQALSELNLFRGTPYGFELERQMTRAEASAMLVRFLGAEKRAMSGNFSHPFTDVPAWAENYVGWLYQSGLTKGISKTLYGSQQPVTAWQYATFITRALHEHENIMPELITEDEINEIDKENNFLRGDAAIISVRALGCTYTKNENFRPLADVCIERGMFTGEQFAAACGDFFGSTYQFEDGNRIVRRLLGIETGRTADGGYFTFDTIDTIASDGTKYDPFVYKQNGETVIIYTLQPETMKTSELARREGIRGHYNYKNLFKLGETHFIFETLADEDKNTVLAVRNGKVSEVFSFVNGGETPWYPYADKNVMIDTDSALIITNKKYFRVTESGFSEIGEKNLSPIAYIDGDIFAKRINESSVDILLMDAKTGEEKISYNIPDDIARGEYGEGYCDLDRQYEKYYYGEAGLYYRDEKTLIQVTGRPVNGFFKDTDGSYVILTHKPGKRFSGRDRFGGNEIMRINSDKSEAYITPENMSLSVDSVFLKDGKVHFTTATGVGMMNFDVFTYRIEDNGKFTVTDFSAGRPEVMNGFSWDNPDAYKAEYIAKEQKRITNMGY